MRSLQNRSFALLLVILFLPAIVSAQRNTSANKKAQEAYELARAEIGRNNYPGALKYLNDAVKADEKFIAAYQQTGDLNKLLKKNEAAKAAYLAVIRLDPEFYRGTYLSLAEIELAGSDYLSAIIHLRKYASYPQLPPENIKRANKLLADAAFSLEALKHPVPFTPLNLGKNINTTDEEYLPVLTADEDRLIFTRRTGSNEDFYTSTRANKVWQPASWLSQSINTPNFNEGAQCISPDGQYLFFTGCNRPGGSGSCDIYLSKKEGKDWSAPFNLGAPVNTRGWESQPSISPDGRTLYFCSNRAGGLGGYDLWKSDLQPVGGWSEAINLGPKINTAYDEQSPFIHPDNQTLYFSSSGWPGMGNKDVFLSRKDDAGNWQTPVNLGYPINTSAEEAGLTVSSNGKTAFFNAERKEGYGGQDIYSFELPAAVRPALVTYVAGAVFDKETKDLLGAGVKITDVASGMVVYEDLSDPETGTFLATMPAGKTYALTISKPGYVFYSASYTLKDPASASKPYQLNVPLEKIKIGATAVLRNVFFDTDKYELLTDSREELRQLIDFLQLNPGVSILIGGHTDAMGDEKANLILSENRARSVYNFLLANKIAPSRLTFKGFGASQPVASNTNDDGRKLNRRTAFTISNK